MSGETAVPGPVPGLRMTSEYVASIARFAYVWGWPMVSMINRRTALTSVDEPGLRGGALPNAPMGHVCMLTDYIPADQRFVACTNQDVLYGFGFAALDDEPIVIEVPDHGDRFWVAPASRARRAAEPRGGAALRNPMLRPCHGGRPGKAARAVRS